MKHIIVIITLLFQINISACDWALEVNKVEDGYLYSDACHLEVGKQIKLIDEMELQITDLNKLITLKDLRLKETEEMYEHWREVAMDQNKRVNSLSRSNKWANYLHFGLGVIATGMSVYLAGQLAK